MCCYGNSPLDFKLECDYFLLPSSWKKKKKKVPCLWSIAQSQSARFEFRKQLRHQLDVGSPGF